MASTDMELAFSMTSRVYSEATWCHNVIMVSFTNCLNLDVQTVQAFSNTCFKPFQTTHFKPFKPISNQGFQINARQLNASMHGIHFGSSGVRLQQQAPTSHLLAKMGAGALSMSPEDRAEAEKAVAAVPENQREEVLSAKRLELESLEQAAEADKVQLEQEIKEMEGELAKKAAA